MSRLTKAQQRIANVTDALILAKYGITHHQISAQLGSDHGKRAYSVAVQEATVFVAMLDAANKPTILVATEVPR